MMTTATEIARRIRAGEVTSREVTEQLLARIAHDHSVNAVVETRAEFALRCADEADAAVADERDVGPLHGVPMTIKECFNVAGLHTTWGNPAFAEYVADRDAVVVERLTRAGAIIVGKSNVHTMLADFGQTTNEIYGRTNNPADLTRTPGGSSGGGAAALAAALSYLEYGSDLVGSIRLPAAYCGVYGLKPTSGLVPLQGFQVPGPPEVPNEFPNLSTIGPLARSAADLRTALRVTGGPPPPYSWELRRSRHDRLADFRVGVVTDHPAAPVSREVGDVLSATVDRIGRSGAKIVEGWPDGVDPSDQAEAFGSQVELFFALHGGEPSPLSLAEVIEQERRRMSARMKWQQYFEEVDVLVCPASFTAAFRHDERPFEERTITTSYGEQRYDAQVFWIAHASLTGHPALSMPIGQTPDGLPVGAQVIGPWHEDDTAITFVELLAG
ncbi:amidase [Kribbella capetownensis]|uniref:Amidase n=1 Tax=Kribbella capetownensis TaxID=1572659 RepID=A0A4R0JTF9_9ACTN|nr:amidase family protein [Kribbella capetownensis]TCC50209.1 amidase [Kribbella capetownensis]